MGKSLFISLCLSVAILTWCSVSIQKWTVDDLTNCETIQDLNKPDIEKFNWEWQKFIADISNWNTDSIDTILSEKIVGEGRKSLESMMQSLWNLSNTELVDILKVKNNTKWALCWDPTKNPQWTFIISPLNDYPDFVSLIYKVQSSNFWKIYIVVAMGQEQNTQKIIYFGYQAAEISWYWNNYFVDAWNLQFQKWNKRNAYFLYKIAWSLSLHTDLIKNYYIDVLWQKMIDINNQEAGDRLVESGNVYQIKNVDLKLMSEDFWLEVYFMPDTLDNKDKLLKESTEIAAYINNKYPEYRQVFDNLVVTAFEEIVENWTQKTHTYTIKNYKLKTLK